MLDSAFSSSLSPPAAFYRLWFLDGFGFSLCENPFGWLLRSKKLFVSNFILEEYFSIND